MRARPVTQRTSGKREEMGGEEMGGGELGRGEHELIISSSLVKSPSRKCQWEGT